MRALSYRQPWASIVIDGPKDIENRAGRTHHRGWLLVHASQFWSEEYDTAVWAFCLERGVLTDDVLKILQRAPVKGGIIGAVEILDCVTTSPSPWFMGPHGYVIGRKVKLPFFECRGCLGIFNVDLPPETEALIPA